MSDFGMKEMQEYITDRVQSNLIDTAEDFAVECLKYYIKNQNEVTICRSVEMEIIALMDSEGNVEAMATYIGEKYNICITDYSDFSEEFGNAVSLLKDVVEISNNLRDLYNAWSNFNVNPTLEGRSKVMQQVFRIASTIAGTSDGIIGKIVSEQLELGAFILKKGTALAVEYNKRFEQLEEIWQEMEETDQEINDELQEKINKLISDSKSLCQSYEAAKMYDAIMQEYGWLFNLATKEDSESIKKQYSEISGALSNGKKMMDMYNKVFGNCSEPSEL